MCITSLTVPLLPVATALAQCECRLGFLCGNPESPVSHSFQSTGFALNASPTDRCRSVPSVKKHKVSDTTRPYSSPPIRLQEIRSKSREPESSPDRGSTSTNSNSGSYRDSVATHSPSNTKRTPKVQSDLAANSTLTLNENEPGSRSGQGHKFRNKVLPLYGDIDSLLPPRAFPDVPLNVTPQTTSTSVSTSSQGYRTSEMTDNLKNEAKTATTTKHLGRYAASINSDYIVTGDRGDNEDEIIHSDTWCLKYDEDEMRNVTNSNSRLEREYSTISDFTSLTDTTPLVKADMKRSLTGELRQPDGGNACPSSRGLSPSSRGSYPSTRGRAGYENPVFSCSLSVDSTCSSGGDGVLDPTPVKRCRSDTGTPPPHPSFRYVTAWLPWYMVVMVHGCHGVFTPAGNLLFSGCGKMCEHPGTNKKALQSKAN